MLCQNLVKFCLRQIINLVTAYAIENTNKRKVYGLPQKTLLKKIPEKKKKRKNLTKQNKTKTKNKKKNKTKKQNKKNPTTTSILFLISLPCQFCVTRQ